MTRTEYLRSLAVNELQDILEQYEEWCDYIREELALRGSE